MSERSPSVYKSSILLSATALRTIETFTIALIAAANYTLN